MNLKFKEISIFKDITKITQINKGWSFDMKYKIETNNKTYMLRTAPLDKYKVKEAEYKLIETLYQKGLSTHEPIEFGLCDNGQTTFLLLEYIEGDQAELILPSLTIEKQYQLGLKMGKELKEIHKLNYTLENNWTEQYKKKIISRIDAFRKCGFKSEIMNEIIEFVEKNTYLLFNRPTSQSHGDFHSGNLIITPEENIYIIDYNRMKIGDPYYEFNRIYFSYRISPYFAKGQIEGYFNNDIPDDFFLYLKFYLLSVMIGNIPWAMMYDQTDVDFAKESIDEVYEEYNNLKDTIPKWFMDAK